MNRVVAKRLPACKAVIGHYHANCKGEAGPFKDATGAFVVRCDCACHQREVSQ